MSHESFTLNVDSNTMIIGKQIAVEFIQKFKEEGKKVYIHCRAGHGRSAAITYAWILSQCDEPINMEVLNQDLCKLRNVRKALYRQPNLNAFRSWLQLGK